MEGAKSASEHFLIVGVADARDVPAVADEARGDILAECQRGVAFDGDVVVVVDPAEIGEPQVTRERGSFAADAFHHAAVAGQRVDVVVDHLEARPIEVLRHPASGQ